MGVSTLSLSLCLHGNITTQVESANHWVPSQSKTGRLIMPPSFAWPHYLHEYSNQGKFMGGRRPRFSAVWTFILACSHPPYTRVEAEDRLRRKAYEKRLFTIHRWWAEYGVDRRETATIEWWHWSLLSGRCDTGTSMGMRCMQRTYVHPYVHT